MNLVSEPILAIAESDAVVRDSVVQALEDNFKVVVMAKGSGKSALLATAQLVIYDLNLGIRGLKSLRERYPEVPIVVITPTEPTATLNQALELEKTEFITKPVNTEELRIRVDQCLRRWSAFSLHGHGYEMSQPKSPERSEPVREQSVKSITVPLTELHGPSGRLSAAAIAKYLDVPLSEIAKTLHMNYTALHKTPDSPSAQPALVMLKRILVILTEMLGPQKIVRAWLNSPHPNLGHRSPLATMLAGQADAVLGMLENALAGVPS